MWQKPWGYKEGFAICGGLFLTGTFVQITIGKCELSILSYDFIYVFFSLYFVFYWGKMQNVRILFYKVYINYGIYQWSNQAERSPFTGKLWCCLRMGNAGYFPWSHPKKMFHNSPQNYTDLHKTIFNLLTTNNIYLCKSRVICGEYEYWHIPLWFSGLPVLSIKVRYLASCGVVYRCLLNSSCIN